MNFICLNNKCSKQFSSAERDRKFCSSSCAAIVNNAKYPKRKKTLGEKECLTCKKIYYSNRRNAKYCSQKCHQTRPNIQRYYYNKKTCLTCGKEFHQADKVRNCSRECGSQYRYDRWIKKWLAGEVDGGVGKSKKVPKTRVKRYIRERNNFTCELCGQGNVWENKPLVLHVDHIDGNNKNNTPENFRSLCPNCHTQTDTYVGRNIPRKKRMK